MNRMLAFATLTLLVLAPASNASAQPLAAKDGPIVYGHHHLNATSADEHRKFWVDAHWLSPIGRCPLGIAIAFVTDPWGTYIELTEGLDKVS